MKNNIHEKFSGIDLLNYLYAKIIFIFHAQRYILTVLEEALRRSRMVGILGREGMGKSSAIAKFINENSNVYYLRIGTTYMLSNFFNEMLFQVSGVYPTVHDTLFLKMKTLSHLLTKDNSKKLIIVDDAGRLSPRALGVFFELRDNTIATTAFVFVGLAYFQKNLLRSRKNGVPGLAEFIRRVSSWYNVPGLRANEAAAYGAACNLTASQLVALEESKVETIAELENMVNAILEEAEQAKKEERPELKIPVPGQAVVPNTKSGKKTSEDDEEQEDELEEALALQKKEAAKKARKAKEAKKAINANKVKQQATRRVASV